MDNGMIAQWFDVVAALRLGERMFMPALAHIAKRPPEALSEADKVGALVALAEAGTVSVALRDANDRANLAAPVTIVTPGSPAWSRIRWVEGGRASGAAELMVDGTVRTLTALLKGAELVLALDAAMPAIPATPDPEVEGVSFLPDGRAVAEIGPILRLVEAHREAWWWIASPVRNASFAERAWPETAAGMLAALFDPTEPGFACVFGNIDGRWEELPWDARPVIADAAGAPVGIVTVFDAAARVTRTVRLGFPVVPVVHHLETLAAEAEARAKRAAPPDPETLARARARAEAEAKARAEEAKKAQAVAEAMRRASDRAREERAAAERARVARLLEGNPAKPFAG